MEKKLGLYLWINRESKSINIKSKIFWLWAILNDSKYKKKQTNQLRRTQDFYRENPWMGEKSRVHSSNEDHVL